MRAYKESLASSENKESGDMSSAGGEMALARKYACWRRKKWLNGGIETFIGKY